MLRRKQKQGTGVVRDGVRVAIFEEVTGEGFTENVTFEPRREGDQGCAMWVFVGSASEPKGMANAKALPWGNSRESSVADMECRFP